MSRRLACLALAAATAGGCELVTDSFVTNDFSGDPFPVQVDVTSGAVIVGLREVGVQEQRTATLDILSPITLVDPGPDVAPTVTNADLLILGQRSTGELDLPRARLPGARIFSLHPCEDDPADPVCYLGTEAARRPYDAIVGADALAGDAVRLRLGFEQLFILADVAGDEQQRGEVCDAVFPSPYRGGGTLVIAGTELGFAGRRVTMPTCLGANPDPTLPQSQRGLDALLLISTSIGTTLLGEATYERYRLIRPAAPALADLPVETLYLPSGPVSGRKTTVDRLALVARSGSTPRAPCRHVFGHHLLLERDCEPEEDCPCEGGERFCPMPAMMELDPPGGLEVLVIPDDNPTLQSLRAELRPDQPEVDGILGTNALLTMELDIDYPHARVLGRCTSEDCSARPALPEQEARQRVTGCIAAGPAPLPD